MPSQNELRVFISSTFRDLQEEREHLIKKIFPEIRSLCRVRGITFTEVDLRWGLTDEDVGLGRVIRTCLDEVDKCRPYFIGITGDRYGFVPSYLDIQKDPQLLTQHPWIEDAAIEGMSITEMEAHYAVLAQTPPSAPPLPSGEIPHATERGGVHTDGARFYFRRTRATIDDVDGDNDERQRLEAYQERIRRSGVGVEEFRDPNSLGRMIYDNLVEIITRDFADARPPTPLEEERSRHEAFSLSRRRAYIANPAYLKKLNDHAASDGPPLVVYAESGSGKSSLFAFWAEQYRRKNPGAHVIEHYVGIGATATDHYAVIRHICMEINERFGREEQIPSEPEKLAGALGQWLGYAEHELRKADPSSLIVILDGLNQLRGEALNLRWIPDVIAPSIRLIISSTVEGTLVELQKRGWSRFGMQALTEAERETIVVRYLAEYRKSLNVEQTKRIAGDYKCGHPLFLKTVLEELRLVGRHEELEAKIESYLLATGTEDLFQRVLERIEDDYTQRAVRDVMSLLSASSSGLDERELSELSGVARLKIATMIAGLDYHLVRKEGRLSFFHDYLRRAVEKRYLAEELKQRPLHLKIAEYFQEGVMATISSGMEVSTRMARELAYQLHAAGAQDRLGACLSTIPVFLALYDGETLYQVLRYWSSMDEGTDVAGMYRRGLSEWAMEDAAERSRCIGLVSDLLERLGHWPAAIALERERLAVVVERGDRSEEAASRRSIGRLLTLRGEYDDSLAELAQALDLCTELGDRSGVALAIGGMGEVYARQGDLEHAMECFKRQLGIAEELGDRRGVSIAIGGMGIVYSRRGEFDGAMECFERQLSIAVELGDRTGVSRAIGHMGNVHSSRGEYEQAMECYGNLLSVAQELGDRRGVSSAIGHMGNVHTNRGEYEQAMECHERKLSIAEQLGDRVGVSVAIGSMGNVYYRLGEYERALDCYQRQWNIADELGDRRGVSLAFGNMGIVHYARGEYERAFEFYERQLSIDEDLGDRAGVGLAIGGLAMVYYNRGEYQRALECYERQVSIAEELGDRSGAGMAIGNKGMLYSRRREYDRALEHLSRAIGEYREIGARTGVSDCLSAIAEVLLALVEGNADMPGYLSSYVPGGTNETDLSVETWRMISLQRARECVEECVAISEELSMADTLVSARVLLARISAGEGDVKTAVATLRGLLDETSDDDQRAELHYWLWKLNATDNDHRAESLRLYRVLFEQRPKHDYQERIAQLEVGG